MTVNDRQLSVVREAGRRWRLAFLFLAISCGGESVPRGDSTPAASPAPVTPQPRADLPDLPGFANARPVDEAAKDPSLLAFRDTLIGIATRRDSAALHARLHQTVKFSFGDSRGGPSAFFAHWKRFHSMDSLWTVMKDVLDHGGRLAPDKSFRAPWTFEALPDTLDAFEYVVVRDSGAVAWPAPDSSQAPVGTLSYEIVRAVNVKPDSTWRPVKLADGRTVYVAKRHVRSPIEWRIGMRKYGARWMIDFFVAGD